MKNTLNKVFICIIYTGSYTTLLYADNSNNTCNSVLNISNNPSHYDSPCSVPFKRLFIELSYTKQKLNNHAGGQQIAPNAEIRFGLPSNNEFFLGPPNYIIQTSTPKTGSTNLYFGIKHTISYNQKWIFALEEIVDVPGGSYADGSQNWGSTLNGVASYTINAQFSVTGMFGISRLSDAKILGGRSFNTINPDMVLSYSPNTKISIYGEVYGQSKVTAETGAGFNFDTGILFLVNPSTVFYISAGQQLYNYLGDFTHYFNLGMSVML